MAEIKWYLNEKCRNGVGVDVDKKHNGTKNTFCTLDNVQLRFLCPDDLEEVRALCQDWFPIEYPFYWYEEITSSTSHFYSLAATYNSKIIGLIVAEIKPYSMMPREDSILSNCFLDDGDIAYILSLGVLNEYRRNGVATLLLDSFLNHLTSNEKNQKVKAVFLHVLTTNSAAIMFYEKKRFKLHTFLPYYYFIQNTCKDGFMYVLYINGGHGPWSIYDYVKFICSKLIKGGGLIPWFTDSLSRALRWMWSGNKCHLTNLNGNDTAE